MKYTLYDAALANGAANNQAISFTFDVMVESIVIISTNYGPAEFTLYENSIAANKIILYNWLGTAANGHPVGKTISVNTILPAGTYYMRYMNSSGAASLMLYNIHFYELTDDIYNKLIDVEKIRKKGILS